MTVQSLIVPTPFSAALRVSTVQSGTPGYSVVSVVGKIQERAAKEGLVYILRTPQEGGGGGRRRCDGVKHVSHLRHHFWKLGWLGCRPASPTRVYYSVECFRFEQMPVRAVPIKRLFFIFLFPSLSFFQQSARWSSEQVQGLARRPLYLLCTPYGVCTSNKMDSSGMEDVARYEVHRDCLQPESDHEPTRERLRREKIGSTRLSNPSHHVCQSPMKWNSAENWGAQG